MIIPVPRALGYTIVGLARASSAIRITLQRDCHQRSDKDVCRVHFVAAVTHLCAIQGEVDSACLSAAKGVFKDEEQESLNTTSRSSDSIDFWKT
jgi:hypothetical protein